MAHVWPRGLRDGISGQAVRAKPRAVGPRGFATGRRLSASSSAGLGLERDLAEGASLSLRPTRALSEATAAAPTPGSPRKPCTSVISVSFNIFVCFSPFFAHSMVVVIVGGWELSFPDRAQASLVASSLLSS